MTKRDDTVYLRHTLEAVWVTAQLDLPEVKKAIVKLLAR